MKKTLKIGFIGLGKMGAGMCSCIQKAGFDLIVYNRTRSKTVSFEQNGAKVANSPREAVEDCDIIFTSLMDDASVIDICNGVDGILMGLKSGAIHIGLTTIQPSTSDFLGKIHKEKNTQYIAGPVVGRPDAAQAGKLISFLAGDAHSIEMARSVIESYSQKILLIGDKQSMASSLKISTNYMAMTQLVMLGEIFTFAEKSGLDRNMILMIAKLFFAGNEPMSMYSQKIKDRDFDDVGFDLSAGLKDVLLFEKAFTDVGVRPGLITIAKENLVSAMANGLAKKDWSALTEISRRASGLESQVN
jgi:3-hydroxyisobutyrate dehydrogenase-like beta-hydroxyacid dehydrogenase